MAWSRAYARGFDGEIIRWSRARHSAAVPVCVRKTRGETKNLGLKGLYATSDLIEWGCVPHSFSTGGAPNQYGVNSAAMIKEREDYSYLKDEAVPSFSAGGAFAVMDAHCALCARGATWIAQNDKAEQFKIIPVQSALGSALMRHYGLDPSDPASWLYVESGRAYTSLDGLIRVGWRLGGMWKLLSLLCLIPPNMRDRMYRYVAVNRVRFFGRADLCSLPDPEVRKRLVL